VSRLQAKHLTVCTVSCGTARRIRAHFPDSVTLTCDANTSELLDNLNIHQKFQLSNLNESVTPVHSSRLPQRNRPFTKRMEDSFQNATLQSYRSSQKLQLLSDDYDRVHCLPLSSDLKRLVSKIPANRPVRKIAQRRKRGGRVTTPPDKDLGENAMKHETFFTGDSFLSKLFMETNSNVMLRVDAGFFAPN